MWKDKSRPDEDFETASCPVCRAIFGHRDKTLVFKGHCRECKTTFWWKPWAVKPSAVLDRDEKKGRCGCASCGR